ncbi:MAG: hypothetical protein AVDCRST_MAG25-1988, partial [uncultured Rubrobacteraceae bacterium]
GLQGQHRRARRRVFDSRGSRRGRPAHGSEGPVRHRAGLRGGRDGRRGHGGRGVHGFHGALDADAREGDAGEGGYVPQAHHALRGRAANLRRHRLRRLLRDLRLQKRRHPQL